MELPRGMRDISGAELRGVELVRGQFMRLAGLHGYDLVDPSPIESLKVLEAKSGPSIRDEIYAFQDKGGREVGLRFDFTVGLMRHAAAQRSMPLPAKLASFGGVFRYDEPQRGRYRYFHQWNVEAYGPSGPAVDAELAEFTYGMLDGLGLRGVSLRLNHRGLVEALLTKTVRRCTPPMLRAMDRLQKRPREQLVSELASAGIERREAEQVLDLASVSGTVDTVESKLPVSDLEPWGDLREVLGMLEERGVPAEADLGIVRGLDYYSGIVFEAYAGSKDALAGGGRYDKLAAAMGREDLGAAGAAGGVERTVLAMAEQNLLKEPGPRGTRIIYADGMQKEALLLASKLRSRGVQATADLSAKSFKKQFEAARSASRYAVILEKGSVSVRNLESRAQRQVSAEDLLADPRKYLP